MLHLSENNSRFFFGRRGTTGRENIESWGQKEDEFEVWWRALREAFAKTPKKTQKPGLPQWQSATRLTLPP
jgi:hypothetical protein